MNIKMNFIFSAPNTRENCSSNKIKYNTLSIHVNINSNQKEIMNTTEILEKVRTPANRQVPIQLISGETEIWMQKKI